MNQWLIVWCTLLTHGNALADIHLRGVLTVSGQSMFALSQDDAPAQWRKIGESFLDFKLTDYDPVRESLTLRKGDEIQTVRLPPSAVRDSVEVNLTRVLAEAENLTGSGHKQVERALRQYRMMEMLHARGLERFTSKPLTPDETVVAKAFLARRTEQVRERMLDLEAAITAAKQNK
jgi:hypothetical protein